MMSSRLRLSLGTFLLLVTVFVLAFSHILTSRRLAATSKELANLRYEYGHLVVADSSRPHVLRYAQQDNPWKWHVYLPLEKDYTLTCGVGEVSVDSVPRAADLQYVQQTQVSGDGENKTVFVSLTKSDSDTMKLSIGADGSQTISQLIPQSDIYQTSVFNRFSAGHREPFVPGEDKPFVLFYQTERGTKPPASRGVTAHGVVVWMVPAK